MQTRSLFDGSKWAIVPIEEQEHNNCWSSSNSDLFELDDDERQRDVVELQLHAERIKVKHHLCRRESSIISAAEKDQNCGTMGGSKKDQCVGATVCNVLSGSKCGPNYPKC